MQAAYFIPTEMPTNDDECRDAIAYRAHVNDDSLTTLHSHRRITLSDDLALAFDHFDEHVLSEDHDRTCAAIVRGLAEGTLRIGTRDEYLDLFTLFAR